MRTILTRCRDGRQGDAIPGHDDGAVRFHMSLLIEGGLATGSIMKDYTHPTEIPLAVVLTSVTAKGYDLLEASEAPAGQAKPGGSGEEKSIAFTIMQIGDADLDSVYREAIRPAVEDCGLAAKRVDKHTEGGLLKSEIIEFIRSARIVVADVTNERPNCYLEIGFCMGTGKFSNLILTARHDHLSTHPAYSPNGPRIHFDLQGYDMLYWDPANLRTFREELGARIRRRLSIAERSTPRAVGKEEPGGDWMRAFVMGSRQEMQRRGFTRFMEVEYWVTGAGVRWDQDALLEAARVAQVPGSGWPVGMVLEPPDAGAPRPRRDGIHAEIVGGPSTNAYDAWAINRTGHFVQTDSPIEAMTGADEVQFDTTIRRTAEALVHARRLYRALGISETQEISVRIGHNGLIDKALGAADAARYLSFTRRSSEDRVVQEIDVPLRDLAGDALARQVEELVTPLFMVFQFMRFDSSVYDEIVARFRATHPDS